MKKDFQILDPLVGYFQAFWKKVFSKTRFFGSIILNRIIIKKKSYTPTI